mmetsp:Transcript_4021/g.9443  ORF Transcript_4021/g.9443 Transcript_4021/m.9443 type:complete len:162 (-) Transcript_4021:23-508(-)|eukprot:s1172_g12.t1
MALLRLEVLVFVSALLLQGVYVQFCNIFANSFSGPANITASALAETEAVVEVREFLSPDCDGPPARLWHVVPFSACMALRPQMQMPGSSHEVSASAPFYGRVSCDTLRDAEGGYVEICSDEDCSEEGCQRVSVVPEGECGTSFTGFAGASWRCIKSTDMPK